MSRNSNHRRVVLCAVMCVILMIALVPLAPGVAAWEPAQHISQPGYESKTPAIAVRDQYVHAVWTSFVTATMTHDIYYNRYHPSVGWETPRFVAATAGDSITPDIAVYGDEVFVVWCDNSMPAGYYDVYISMHPDNGDPGIPWGALVDLSSDVAADAENPSVVALDSTAYVAFSEYWGTEQRIYFRKWDGLIYPRVPLTTYPSEDPDISIWRTGVSKNLVVAWQGMVGTPPEWEILSRRSIDNGDSWASEVPVTVFDDFDSVSPSIDYNRNLVHATWIDYRTPTPQVYYTRSTNGGQTWDPDRVISTSSTYWALSSSIASIGPCVGVVWNEFTGSGILAHDTIFRRSCDSGLTWENIEVLEGSTWDSVSAYIAADKRLHWDLDLYGDFHVVFEVTNIPPLPSILYKWVETNEYVRRSNLPSLPGARFATSAVWRESPTRAYIFGGITSTLPLPYLTDILEFDPGSETLGDTGKDLVRPGLGYTSAVWDTTFSPPSAYVFGGRDEMAVSDKIVKYTPDTGWIGAMGTTLPTPRYGTSAVRASTFSTGYYVYIFGGIDSSGNYLGDILKYDINFAIISTLGIALPTPRAFTAAVWDEGRDRAYIIGGKDQSGMGISEILEFNPSTETYQYVGSLPPTVEGVEGPRWGISAVRFEGADEVYIFAGSSTARSFDTILIFHPSTGQTRVSCLTFYTTKSYTSAVWNTIDDKAIVFGGGIESMPPSGNQVVYYIPDTT